MKIIKNKLSREPDRIIGPADDPYLLRWYLIPRNRFFNIYLHKFCKSDDDRALHDHPWLFNASILLKGEYLEHLPPKNYQTRHKRRVAGSLSGITARWGKAPHRIELYFKKLPPFSRQVVRESYLAPVWTLFITGPVVRRWGFYCPQGWRHWRDFTRPTARGNETGRGCE